MTTSESADASGDDTFGCAELVDPREVVVLATAVVGVSSAHAGKIPMTATMPTAKMTRAARSPRRHEGRVCAALILDVSSACCRDDRELTRRGEMVTADAKFL